MNKFMIFLYLL